MLLNVSLTGAPLTILLIVAAVALPIVLALAWRRLPGRVGGAALRIGMIISCQVIAVMAAGIALNRAFLFYDSWAELLGHQGGGGGQAAIAVTDNGQLVPADGSQGRISILTVHGKVSGATEQVLVWLPPQYDAAGEKRTRFPVIMALPGQPGTPAGIFKTLDLGSNAMQMIKSGQVKPFVAVIPPLSIAQPRVPNAPTSREVRRPTRGWLPTSRRRWSGTSVLLPPIGRRSAGVPAPSAPARCCYDTRPRLSRRSALGGTSTPKRTTPPGIFSTTAGCSATRTLHCD